MNLKYCSGGSHWQVVASELCYLFVSFYKCKIALIAFKLLLFHLAGSIDTVAQIEHFCVYPAACWQQGKLTVSLNLHIKCVEFFNTKLHLLHFNCHCFMWFMSIKLPRLNNSVSTQGKVTMSLHVCIKCVYFYKLEIAFIAFELILFQNVGSIDTGAQKE